MQRLARDRGMPAEQARARMAAQASDEQRRAAARRRPGQRRQSGRPAGPGRRPLGAPASRAEASVPGAGRPGSGGRRRAARRSPARGGRPPPPRPARPARPVPRGGRRRASSGVLARVRRQLRALVEQRPAGLPLGVVRARRRRPAAAAARGAARPRRSRPRMLARASARSPGEPGPPPVDHVADALVPHPGPAAAEGAARCAASTASCAATSGRPGRAARPAAARAARTRRGTRRAGAGTSTSRWAGARSTGCCSGTHHIAVVSRSATRRVGRARSKSISATGRAGPEYHVLRGDVAVRDELRRAGQGGELRRQLRTPRSRPNQGSSGGGAQPADASCSARTSRAIPATTSSVQAQASGGAPGTSPGTKSSTSRPRSSTPRNRGAPVKPTRCEVPQVRRDERRLLLPRPAHRVADPHHAFGDVALRQRHLHPVPERRHPTTLPSGRHRCRDPSRCGPAARLAAPPAAVGSGGALRAGAAARTGSRAPGWSPGSRSPWWSAAW